MGLVMVFAGDPAFKTYPTPGLSPAPQSLRHWADRHRALPAGSFN